MRHCAWILVALLLACSGPFSLDEISCRRYMHSIGLTFEMPRSWSLRCDESLGTMVVHPRGDARTTAPRIHFSTMLIDAEEPLEVALAERLFRILVPRGSATRIETETHPVGGVRLRVNTRYERGSPMVRWGLFWRGSNRLDEALYADVHWPEDAPADIPATLQAILDSVTFTGHLQ